MVDIASLGFKIDTSDVAKADSALDGLAATGAKTEAAAKGVGNAWTEAGRKTGAAAGQMGSTSSAIRQGNDALRAQQAELGKLLGQINPVVAALDRLDKQEAELRKFKSKGLVDIDTFREYKAQIDSSRASLAGVDGAIRRTGNTSKQTAQALRQLPAQFSDIAISLQAGQSPLTVFLQQGAQIKDSFGGVGPALRAVGGAALGMINPLTLAAAALAALAFAYKQGSDEGTAFNTALILTGNIAGTSVGQLQNAAAAMDKVSGTQRQAAQALAEVAGTGKFTSEQILSIASAAVAMEDATGKAIADTVSEFKKLADEPAAAAAKLNEQYNFLTASVYEQITALESQGDAAGAAQLAIDSFGQAMQDRANEITNDLGYIERAWKAIKDGAAEAWDEMLGVGRTQTPEQRLDELTTRGVDAGRTGTAALLFGAPGAAVSLGRQLFEQVGTSSAKRNEEIGKTWQEIQDRDEKAWVEGMQARQEQDAIAAQQRIDQLSKTVMSNADKRADKLEKLKADLAKIRQTNPGDSRLEPGNIALLEKKIAEEFKDPKGPRAAKIPAVRDDAATRLLITLREQQAVLSSQLDAETKLTTEQKKRAEFESQIADLKTKGILTADQKSLLANQDSIRAQLDKNVALAEEVRLHNDSIKLQERSAQLQASIQASAQGRREQQQRNLDAFGQGSAQQAQAEAAANIFREFRRYQDQLNKNTPKDLLGSAQYLSARESIGEGLRAALADHDEYYAKLKIKQADWKNGASEAFADYMDNAQNVSAQTANLIGSTMENLSTSISDSLVGAIRHGEDLRETMADVANTIFDQVLGALIEMGVRYGINAALEMAGIGAVSAAKIAAKGSETAAEVAGTATETGAKVTAAGAVSAAQIAAITATTTASAAATATTTATQVGAAATTAAAWTPAAIVSSIGSFGGAAAIGLAAVIAALAFTGGFRKGGYTGNGGVNQAAGVVHGQEYVFDADAVKRIGVGNLEALRSGRDLQISGASAAAPGGQAGGMGVSVVNQMSFPGITDSREAKRSTAQASRQIARAVAGAGRYN
jgi:lambda family phage tail tape measure protein